MTFETVTGCVARDMDPDGIQWPPDSIVVYAISDGKVVGRSAIIQLPHIEGTWVDKHSRSSTLAFRLVREAEKTLQQAGKTYAWAFVHEDQPEVAGYMERIGYKRMPMKLYAKELRCQ